MLYYLHLNTFKLKFFPNTVSRLLAEWLPHQRLQGSSIGTQGEQNTTKGQMKIKRISAVIFPSCPCKKWNRNTHEIYKLMCNRGMYVICSINILWDQLPQYVFKLQHQVMAIKSDGFWFLHAVHMILGMDHAEEKTLDKLQSSILDHMAANVNYYNKFHTGNVLKDVKRYFKFDTCCDSVLDLLVVTMARPLKLNLKIYQKGPTAKIQILEHITLATTNEAHLKFTCDPSNVANNHYKAIFLLDAPMQRHTDEEVTIEIPCPSTLKQPISLDDVIDLKDDSKMTTSEQSDSLQNNTSNNELQFPMHLFLKMEAEWLDELPHDINGFKLCSIKCSPQECVQKSQDLRYFKMNTSRRKDLIGMRKVGRCIRSLYCMSDDCQFKHSAEGKLNTMNLQNVSRHKVCFSCGNISRRKWCSTCKMTEYCRESEILILYHTGVHKCPLKKDIKIYRKQVRDAVLRNRGLGA